jgi:hypothetical protein
MQHVPVDFENNAISLYVVFSARSVAFETSIGYR